MMPSYPALPEYTTTELEVLQKDSEHSLHSSSNEEENFKEEEDKVEHVDSDWISDSSNHS